MEKEKLVCIAGHFNPIHPGHLDLIREAKKMGGKLLVIVSNDEQAFKKRGKLFMSLGDRIAVLSALRDVDYVMPSIDTDSSVCRTLEMARPTIFASGCADNHPDAVAEKEVCATLGIETVYFVGGDKTRSSADLLENYAKVHWFTPPESLIQIGQHTPKKDRIYPLHYHTEIWEFLMVLKGEMRVRFFDEKWNALERKEIFAAGEFIMIPNKEGHEVSLSAESVVLEIKQGPYKDDKIYAK